LSVTNRLVDRLKKEHVCDTTYDVQPRMNHRYEEMYLNAVSAPPGTACSLINR